MVKTIIDLFFRVLGDNVEMGCQNFWTDDMATNCAGPIFATIDGKRGIAPMEVSGTKGGCVWRGRERSVA